MSNGVVVALDGPSGSGKSSTAKGVARALGLAYLDTGAQFRALTWWLLRAGVDVHDAPAVAARVGAARVVSGTSADAPTIAVDGVDVSVPIRGPEVTAAVSPVSAVPEVRAVLLELQRRIIEDALPHGGIVVEGRDIGSVVWPQAEIKVYLTADPVARAARRTAEQGGAESERATTQASLLERDRIDSSRTSSPLAMAEGAVHLDTTDLTLDQVVAEVVDLVEALA